MSRGGGLDTTQLVVSMVTITLFIPCIANVFMIAKERGWKTAAAMVAFIFPLAFGVGRARARADARAGLLRRPRGAARRALRDRGAATPSCPLCGLEYVPGGDACREHGCPVALGGCATQHCPRCGYTMPDEERSVAARLRAPALRGPAPGRRPARWRSCRPGLRRRIERLEGEPGLLARLTAQGLAPGVGDPRRAAHAHARDRAGRDDARDRAPRGRGGARPLAAGRDSRRGRGSGRQRQIDEPASDSRSSTASGSRVTKPSP